MPKTKVIFFKERDGSVPFLDRLDDLPSKAQLKCLAKIERLTQEGHELRRPESGLLAERIYELRASYQSVHYRILYFFHGTVAAVVSHGIVKESQVPPVEIGRAAERRRRFELNPKAGVKVFL